MQVFGTKRIEPNCGCCLVNYQSPPEAGATLQVMCQEGLNCLRDSIFPIEITLVGEAIDLLFQDLNRDYLPSAPLARPVGLHPCCGSQMCFTHFEPFR